MFIETSTDFAHSATTRSAQEQTMTYTKFNLLSSGYIYTVGGTIPGRCKFINLFLLSRIVKGGR